MSANIDRLTNSVDTIDVMLKHTDLIINDHQKEFKRIKDKIDQGTASPLTHLDIIEVQSHFIKFATLEKLREVDQKLVKYARNDYVIELNAKIELAKADMSHLAKITYVTQQIDSLSNDIKEAIADFVTFNSIDQHFSLFDAKLKKMKKDFKNEIDEIAKVEDAIESMESNMKRFVENKEFESEVDKIWTHFATFTGFCQYKHLQDHMEQVRPILDDAKHLLNSFRNDNLNIKDIVSRLDEVLLDKASKFSVDQLNERLDQYCLKLDFDNLSSLMSQKTEENKSYIREVQKISDQTLEKGQKEMKETILKIEVDMRRRIQAFLNSNTLKPDEIKSLLASKAGNN